MIEPTCRHGIPATLASDVDILTTWEINPDCFACPAHPDSWDELTPLHVPDSCDSCDMIRARH